MVFSSMVFMCVFLPAVFVLHCILPGIRAKNALLLLASVLFYAYGEPVYIILLFISTLLNYFCACGIDRFRNHRKGILVLAVICNLGILIVFKYTDFILGMVNSVTGLHLPLPQIRMPIGISFFTFQSLSYTIDVYRKDITPLTNLLDYAFYVSFFPQLVAGPIVRARDFIPQIRRPLFVSHEMFGRGIFLIASGLFKKAIISDYISVNFVERIFDNPTLYSGVENLMGVYGYALQIYCDFSGYSDMAIGIALLLGFHFNKNFDSPYKSASITEFWRRWHISLSSWLKDYLYIFRRKPERKNPPVC